MRNRGQTCSAPFGKRSGSFRGPCTRSLPAVSSEANAETCQHSAFKSATGASVTDSLLAERGRIDNSHRMADDTLR
jgi:hypothetical protein